MNAIQERAFEDKTVQEVLQTGTDLRKYSRQIEKELKEIENKSIQDYIKESQNIASLHNQICSCDDILARMEGMLLSFQTDLGSISSEIVSLQKKSVQMSQQLSNRQAVRAPLSQFIDDLGVSEELINIILDSPVTDKAFNSQLVILNHKINFVKEQSFKDAVCTFDVGSVLERLRIKAVMKIRTYFLEQISKFKKPLANYQVPQNVLLKNKFLFEFLLGQERSVAAEISNEYIDTMSKVYFSYFKSYGSRLMKLQYEEAATKDDLMGIEDNVSRGSLFYKTSLKHKATVFTIGSRGDVLGSQLEAPVIVPHAAQKSSVKYPYEALFRSEQYALLDNACREYLFLCEFFMIKSSQALHLFNQIFGKTLKLLMRALAIYVETSYDSIALFLCAHICIRYKILCHKRAVSALDTYWESLQTCIWQRFQFIMELNIQSIRDCDPMKLGREMGPHYVARRYAELSAAMVGLSESFPSDLVNSLLAELREEVELFILKMAAVFPQRKEQLIFLINNYDMILSVLMERTRDHSKEAEAFREHLTNKSNEYVEEILSPHFGGIIQFVREGESLSEDELKNREKEAMQLVNAFTNNWKKSLEELQGEVLRSFPSLVTGGALLQLALTTLLQYYDRFHALLSPTARAQLTNIHLIRVEIKKYRTSF
ncbi:UNVERIFIED_CONTAM: hypothetical protein PYX00_006139 [Menopon gallinae]|uniref:Vacuolar protein sorting-associated protein 52 homolog n=1 Tax=Menopon gallinae TaxID=328185 RepID=A0AAW2HV32_9NEOP